ncbi:hypothetical protein ACJ41O_010140 [Fusarium nematophilum]
MMDPEMAEIDGVMVIRDDCTRGAAWSRMGEVVVGGSGLDAGEKTAIDNGMGRGIVIYHLNKKMWKYRSLRRDAIANAAILKFLSMCLTVKNLVYYPETMAEKVQPVEKTLANRFGSASVSGEPSTNTTGGVERNENQAGSDHEEAGPANGARERGLAARLGEIEEAIGFIEGLPTVTEGTRGSM